jgi:hypothetical protein
MKPLFKDVNWSKNGRTIVIALSTQCHFCNESAPFLRRLAIEAINTKAVKTLAVLPQPITEAQKYLTSEDVHVDDVRQAALGSIGVGGTPTWIIVDNHGIVTDIWVGKLDPTGESQVLNAINGSYSSSQLLGSQAFGPTR